MYFGASSEPPSVDVLLFDHNSAREGTVAEIVNTRLGGRAVPQPCSEVGPGAIVLQLDIFKK
jgi:hypothetical protein